MKKIYVFGPVSSMFLVFTMFFLVYVAIKKITIDQEINFTNILISIDVIAYIILAYIYYHDRPAILFDFNKNMLVIKLGVSRKEDKTISLDYVQKVEIVEDSFGFILNIIDRKGYAIKISTYNYYRINIVEKMQIKRIKRQLAECNNMLEMKKAAPMD